MAIPLSINGAVFEYPQNFDEDWGVDATGWAQAVTNGALYLSGGSFPLTNTVDFGSSFGIKVKSILSKTANPASTGYMGLAKTDTLAWRNNANSANLVLAINGSDNLTFNGTPLGTTSLTNTHIFVGNASNLPVDVAMSGDATIANTGALTIANSAITNVKVSASAAIALTKLAAQTASRAIVSDGSGFLVPATTTSVQIGYLSTTTSDIQTQLDAKLSLSGGTMSGAISMASHKITAITQGSSAGEAATFDQIPTVTNPTAYTPAINGVGTPSNISFWWHQVGKMIHIYGQFQAGTTTATTFSFAIPGTKTIDTSLLTNAVVLGTLWDLKNGTTFNTLLQVMFCDGSDTANLYFSNSSISSGILQKANGTNITSTDRVSIDVWVPVVS